LQELELSLEQSRVERQGNLSKRDNKPIHIPSHTVSRVNDVSSPIRSELNPSVDYQLTKQDGKEM
jgi:hypothetical protein